MRKLRILHTTVANAYQIGNKKEKEIRFVNSPNHPGLLLEMRLAIINSVSNVIDD